MLRWLYLDLNSYFASVEQQLCPELRGKPIIVIPVQTDSTCAIAASYPAKAYGIKTGTPVWEAKKKCKNLITVLARHSAYVEFHHKIIAEMERHIPVSVIASIDEMAAELMENERDPGVAIAIAKAIKKGIKENVGECLTSSIGIAPNRFLAKVASDMQKPDGLTLLDGDTIKQRLFALSLQDLPGIARNMQRRLNDAGIYSVEDLWNLEPSQARKAWGSVEGDRFVRMLHGENLAERETNRSTVGHSHMLAPEFRPVAEARNVARRLLMKAGSRLRRMDYRATHMTLSVRYGSAMERRRWKMTRKMERASDNAALLKNLYILWQRMAEETRALSIRKISVNLHGLVPAAESQLELFDMPSANSRPKQQLAVSVAMDRLNQKYGRDTVTIGALPKQVHGFSGTKIAFARVPELQEFKE